MPVRIYDIAKKLGIESKEVLAKAKSLGIAAAKVPSSSLDKITAEYLEQQLDTTASQGPGHSLWNSELLRQCTAGGRFIRLSLVAGEHATPSSVKRITQKKV